MSAESAFIAALQALTSHPAARGLADDCAVLELGGETLILTHDMMVEGVHWLAGQDPADVAWKLLATNLSDLAAKGAEPIGVLLGYTLTAENTRFAEGLGAALAHFNVPLLGGDTVRSPGPQALGLTALGRATHRPVPSRSGARAGDGVWITGPVGAAMLGFEALQSFGINPNHPTTPSTLSLSKGRSSFGAARVTRRKEQPFDKLRVGGVNGSQSAPASNRMASGTNADTTAYRRPVPRLAEGQALAPLVTAMMDVSDGLLLDCARMAKASGMTIALDPALIPLTPGLPPTRTRDALTWGDDYELLFTLPAALTPPCPAVRIGEVRARGASPLLLGNTPPEGPLGYEHG